MFIWLGRNHSFLRQSLLFLHSQCWKFHTVLSSYLLFYCLRSWTNSVTVSWRSISGLQAQNTRQFRVKLMRFVNKFPPGFEEVKLSDHAEKLNNKIMQIWNITLEVCTWKIAWRGSWESFVGLDPKRPGRMNLPYSLFLWDFDPSESFRTQFIES